MTQARMAQTHSTQAPPQQAAWVPAMRTPLEVRPAPSTPPAADEVVVQNHAVAINPLDWLLPLIGTLIFPWIKYPFILGADLAGEVVEVGAAVTRFRVGDRVLGHAVGTDKKRSRAAEGAFQTRTVVLARMAAPLPDSLAYEHAAVLPLALSTAACGLFQQDHLALTPPSAAPTPTGQTLLVCGGSTSVGSNAIQLAVAAGYEVITTASPRNFEYVRGLGASQVFDYRSATVVHDLIRALDGKMCAGALAIGTGSTDACVDVVHASQGRRFVSAASTAVSFDTLSSGPGRTLQVPGLLARLVASNVALGLKLRRTGVRSKAIFGSTLMDNEVSTLIYEDFLPRALAEGRYLTAPEAEVVGHGLEAIQPALDRQRQGVSARKIVVSL